MRTTPAQLFPYYGGKSTLKGRIVNILNDCEHKTYVELFAGGASIFFSKPILQNVGNVLNDKNDLIVTAYKTAKNYPDLLKSKLGECLYSESLHKQAKQILDNPNNKTDIEIAWAIIYGIRSSFASILRGTFARDRESQKAYAWKNFLDYLPEVLEKLKSAIITCENYDRCIKRWDNKSSLFFVDPPYPGTDQSYDHKFSQSDFDRLIKILNRIEGKFILTTYPNESLKQLKNCRQLKIYKKQTITRQTRNAWRETLIIYNF